jgi:hypothetical protein
VIGLERKDRGLAQIFCNGYSSSMLQTKVDIKNRIHATAHGSYYITEKPTCQVPNANSPSFYQNFLKTDKAAANRIPFTMKGYPFITNGSPAKLNRCTFALTGGKSPQSHIKRSNMAVSRDWLPNGREGILAMACDWQSVTGTNTVVWDLPRAAA